MRWKPSYSPPMPIEEVLDRAWAWAEKLRGMPDLPPEILVGGKEWNRICEERRNSSGAVVSEQESPKESSSCTSDAKKEGN